MTILTALRKTNADEDEYEHCRSTSSRICKKKEQFEKMVLQF